MIIAWSPLARADLLAIVDYLLHHNPAAAVEIEQRVQEAVAQLTAYPGLGRPGRVTGTRERVIADTPYIVVYRVRGHMLDILRVRHGARRWPEAL